MSRCSATKRDGEPCRISVEPGVEFCWAHDPVNRERRQRITSRAGKSKSNKELLSVKKRLSVLADSVLDGSTDKAVGAVASQILNVYLRALETERKWKELGEIEERIGTLEERARSQEDNRRWRRGNGCGDSRVTMYRICARRDIARASFARRSSATPTALRSAWARSRRRCARSVPIARVADPAGGQGLLRLC